MKSSLSRVLGDVTLKDCAVAALLVLVLVGPATCAMFPRNGTELQKRN